MIYTGQEDHSIILTDAAEMTQRFRNSVAPDAIIAEYFGADAINAILAQPGCIGIRLYYGLDAANTPHHIIVGVEANGDDLHNGVLADKGIICPISCSSNNLLNS